ncbi:MAG: ElyC/SanA/YdcF family protein [Eubacterium sp.]
MGIILIILGAVLIAVYLLPIIRQVFNFGSIAGIAMGTVMLVLGLTWNRLTFSQQKFTVFGAIALVVGLWGLSAAILRDGRSDADGKRILVVLGCRVKGDIPSRALKKRVDSAYLYLLSNPQSKAILSGGQGRDEFISEALCMKNMLTERGISPDRLIIEDRSVSTYENIKFSMKYIEDAGVKEIAVATSEYHQKRAKLICKKFGLTAYSVSSKTDPLILPVFVLREIFALAKEYVLK